MKIELAPLPYIDDVKPLSPEDEACMAEIKDVLMKHHRLQRFGLCLMHEHFQVAEDEILLETCNLEKRTLMIRPAKRAALQNVKRIATNWRLDSPVAMAECIQCCTYDDDNKHIGSSHL